MRVFVLCLPFAGVDHSLVHWLPVPDPGLFPCVSGREGGKRDVCDLCWCSVVGSGKQHHIVWTAMVSLTGFQWEVPNLQLIQRIKTPILLYCCYMKWYWLVSCLVVVDKNFASFYFLLFMSSRSKSLITGSYLWVLFCFFVCFFFCNLWPMLVIPVQLSEQRIIPQFVWGLNNNLNNFNINSSPLGPKCWSCCIMLF